MSTVVRFVVLLLVLPVGMIGAQDAEDVELSDIVFLANFPACDADEIDALTPVMTEAILSYMDALKGALNSLMQDALTEESAAALANGMLGAREIAYRIEMPACKESVIAYIALLDATSWGTINIAFFSLGLTETSELLLLQFEAMTQLLDAVTGYQDHIE